MLVNHVEEEEFIEEEEDDDDNDEFTTIIVTFNHLTTFRNIMAQNMFNSWKVRDR